VSARARVFCAGTFFAITLVGAVWLYMYRVPVVLEFVDRAGRRYNPSLTIYEQPWWSVPAAVALVLIGASTVMWLLPITRGPVERFVERFAKPSYYKPSQ
jgi:hypothetical protein